MPINIRVATVSDFPQILELIKELAFFEKAPDKVTNSVDLMLAEKEYFHCFVAETDANEIVGMAIYFFAYYTWVGKSLYLEDLYVKESYRRHKTGSALLKKVFEVANEENCKRVRWQVLSWNKAAIAMYSKSGAEINDEWLNCTFDADGIKGFKM
jgi:GNAT superfamily N-acetyltransferase